jgi:PKD repeat protein
LKKFSLSSLIEIGSEIRFVYNLERIQAMRKTIKSTLAALAIILLAAAVQPLSATVYYVNSATGSDSNNGLSTTTPWRTVSKVNSAMSAFKPGDSILFRGGATFSDANLFIACQGTSANPITFATYGTGRAKFLSRSIFCNQGNGYITVDNFEVSNPSSDGIAFYKKSGWQYGITITNCYVHGSGNVGIILLSVDGYLVEDCEVHSSRNGNIYAYGSSYPIKNGIIRNCVSHDAIQNDGIGIHIGDYGEPCGANHRIIGCRTYGNAEEGIDINSGTYVTILGCNTYGDDYAGIIIESDHCTVRRNKIHDGHVGIHIGASDVTLESNLIYANGQNQILIEPYRDISGVYIYHNTVVAGPNSSGIILDISPRARGLVVKNNIFTSTQYSFPNTYVRFMDGASPASSNSHFDYNVYWRRDGNSSARWYAAGANRSFAAWQSVLGQDIHGQWADPRFVDLNGSDFHLQAGSPCRDTGTDVGVQRDYDGTLIPQGTAPDVGALEYGSSSPPPPESVQAEASASPTSGEAPLAVQFQGSASGGSPPYSYLWQSDGELSSTAQNPSYTFDETGTFTITLTVTDSQDKTDSDSVIIRIYEKSVDSLKVILSASQTSGLAPLSVNFTANASGGTAPYTYAWDFADGGSSALQNPTHSFTQAGTYNVTLTVKDGHNSTVVKTIAIKVSEVDLPADFTCIPHRIVFGAATSGEKTPNQHFHIMDKALGALNWSVTTNRKWLFCNPSSGTGSQEICVRVDPEGLSPGEYPGALVITAPNAAVSPRYVNVILNVYDQDYAPIGAMDTPTEGSVVSGNVPLSGWALDDIQVAGVAIKRSAHADDVVENIGPDGLVYLGEAVFCEDVRQDIPNVYPDYPRTHLAGWGYVLPSYQLPNKGNGSFTIHAIATDSKGQTASLGSRTIIANNAARIQPFGSIDTPQSGEEISGDEYTTQAWVLTPPPKSVPADGNSIWVWLDGERLGNAAYGQYREDIAALFPGYNNALGAGASFSFSPRQLQSGIHSLIWSAGDDAGEADAVDCVYFLVQNPDSPPCPPGYLELKNLYQQDTAGRMTLTAEQVRTGYTLEADPDVQFIGQDRITFELEEMEPVEIHFKTNAQGPVTFYGWGEWEWAVMPMATTLKPDEGVFCWIPTPGFLGTFVFHFAYTDGVSISQPLRVIVEVTAKTSDQGKKKQQEIKR